jgi:tripartite-type tricarboxylate transporter receptor subunit TctC
MKIRFTKFNWLKLSAAFCASAMVFLASQAAYAQKWPSRTVYISVGWAAGGTTDILARAVGQKLSETLGVPVVVKNAPGAAGGVEAASLSNAELDDHVFMMVPPSVLSINEALYKSIGYSPEKDFTAVGLVAQIPNALAVNPASKLNFKTFKELIDYAKANPDKLNYSSAGTGSTGHLTNELLKTQAGIKITHIPYKGNGPALQALLAGEVDLNTDNNAQLLEYIRAGTLRALAVSSAQRWPQLPDVPTFAELGYPDMTTQVWYGLVAKSAMPKEVIDRMNKEINSILADPAFVERLKKMNLEPIPGSPEKMAELIRSERKRWEKVIADSGARAN